MKEILEKIDNALANDKISSFSIHIDKIGSILVADIEVSKKPTSESLFSSGGTHISGERGQSKRNTGECDSKTKVKALKVTPEIYDRSVEPEFCEAFQQRIIIPSSIVFGFIVLGSAKTAYVGDYIIYKDGKFDVCNKEFFDKHYFY